MNFSDLIRNRRNELGLTLEEVARVVGVSKSTILKWERGEIDNPRRDRIALLAAVLQLPPVALVQEECGLPEDYPIKKALAEQIKNANSPKTKQGIYAGLFVDGLTPEEQQRAVDLLKVAFPKNDHDKII